MRSVSLWNNIKGKNKKTEKAIEEIKQIPFNTLAETYIKPTIKLLGDSITAQNNILNHYNSRGFFVQANTFMKQAFDVIGNYGVSGQRSDQILARVDTDILSGEIPSFCSVLVGTNDISQMSTKNLTADKTFANLLKIYDKLTKAGIKIIAYTVPMSSSFKDVPQQEMYFKLNELIKNYARKNNNIILIDIASLVMDDITFASAPNITNDGTHPSAWGAIVIGNYVASQLEKFIIIQPTSLVYSNLDKGNKIKNPMLTGVAGTKATNVTGEVADNWTLIVGDNANAVGSKEPREGRVGNRQLVTITNTNNTSTGYAQFYQDINITTAGLDIKVGEDYYLQTCVKIGKDTVVTKGYHSGVDIKNGSTITNQSYSPFFGTADLEINSKVPNKDLVLRTPNFRITEGTTHLRVLFRLYTANGNFSVDTMELRKV